MVKRSYETSEIRVHWNSERCIHTAICLNALPQVFDAQRRPWIDVHAASSGEIARAIERCPTGALTYERLDGEQGEQAAQTTTIIPWPDGPLFVRGRVEVRDSKGELFETGTRMTLCRCGRSENQPYCDLSHRKYRFRESAVVEADSRDEAKSPLDISEEAGP